MNKLLASLLQSLPFVLALTSTTIWGADHAESPIVESDQGADIADLYAFVDPNDNSRTILAFDVHGFIVPGENSNLAAFDPDVRLVSFDRKYWGCKDR